MEVVQQHMEKVNNGRVRALVEDFHMCQPRLGIKVENVNVVHTIARPDLLKGDKKVNN